MNPWKDPKVAHEQRALVDRQLSETWPPQFAAFVGAVQTTQSPGTILEVGCASGYGRELLDRAGVKYADYAGEDISAAALDIARARYPESRWDLPGETPGKFDVVIDGCALMHVEDWRAHLARLCSRSRRWVVLHRLPVNFTETVRTSTQSYGHEFPAWSFAADDIGTTMAEAGFAPHAHSKADGDSVTLVFARPRHFATYFDAAYWTRARAMWASLRRHGGPVVLHALCWDDEAKALAIDAGMVVTRAAPLDTYKFPGPPRTRVETMWTVGPQFIADTMAECGEPVTYVDADVMFHSSPESLFTEWGGHQAGIVPHGFATALRGLPGPTLESHSVFGLFNVGVVHFGIETVAKRWAERCRDWCYDRIEADKYGDQKYLERWDGAVITQHPGACLGPWAVHTRALDVRNGVIHFGNRPLIAYHYSGYKELPDGHTVATRPEYQLTQRQEEILYRPYAEALRTP